MDHGRAGVSRRRVALRASWLRLHAVRVGRVRMGAMDVLREDSTELSPARR